MKRLWQKIHEISDILHLPSVPNWVCAILLFVLVLRIPSFFEPYYYGDEMIYLTLGQGVRQGLTLYKDVHDNKPPLLYWAAAASGSLFWFKAILAFWNLATIVIFYKLTLVIFKKNERTRQAGTLIFALLTTLPLLEGNTVNAELLMLGPSLLAFLLLLRDGLTTKKIFWAGFLFGVATLFKVPALFDFPVIVAYWLITDLKNWRKIFVKTLILSAGFLTPILATFVWYFMRGALSEYIKAAFLQNVGYLSSWRAGAARASFLVRNAPLLSRAAVTALGSLIVFMFRRKLSKNFILFSIWVLFSLFAATLSERPYPHYIVQAIPPVTLLLATFFAEKSFEQSLTVIPITLAFFVPVFYKFYLYPTGSYYQRFINFATQKISRNEYFADFSPKVKRNYEIADFLVNSSTTSDKVFMWDPDSATVYALSRRLPPIKYVADYHINDFADKKDVASEIVTKAPKFIILTLGHSFPELAPLVKTKYILVSQIGDANIYSRLDLAP